MRGSRRGISRSSLPAGAPAGAFLPPSGPPPQGRGPPAGPRPAGGHPRPRGWGAGDRARLGRELAAAGGWLEAARLRLLNDDFLAKAPASVVETARAREAELAEQVARLRDRLGR